MGGCGVSRAFEVGTVFVACEFLGLFLGNLSIFSEIRFIPNDKDGREGLSRLR